MSTAIPASTTLILPSSPSSSLFSRFRTWATHPWRLLVFSLALLYVLRTYYSSRSVRRRSEPSELQAPGPPFRPTRSFAVVPEDTSATVVSAESLRPDPNADLLEPDFKAACAAATKLKNLDTFQKLRIYAYFKQATVGPCNVGRPSMIDISGCAKWDAWKALGDLSTSNAKEYYIDLIEELGQAGSTSEQKSVDSSGGGGFAMGPAMSRMADTEVEKIAESDKTIFDFTSEGNQEAVVRLLESKVDVNSQNEDGLTPLHWAVDRGNKELVEFLLLKKANINAVDAEDATSLHYAVDCDRPELVEFLLKNGADPSLQNAEGATPDQAASPEVQILFQPQAGI